MSSQEIAPSRLTPHLLTYRLTFLISGLCMGAWAPLVPYARQRVGVDDGALGVLLLCLGLGSLVMMPLAGVLNARKGCRFSMILGITLVSLTLPLLATVHSFYGLMLALALFGAGCGLVDVTMNVQGVMVERNTGRSLMSGFHGLFSVGTIVSAAGITLLLWLGATPLVAAWVLNAALIVFVFTAGRYLLDRGAEQGPVFLRPSGKILLIGILCLLAFLAEGSILDWSAVFLADHRGVAHSLAGLGYTGFAVMMALGRLNGDCLVARLGSRRILVVSGCIAMLGFALVIAVDNWLIGLIGFAVIGIGLSNVAPVYLSLAGSQRSVPGELAIGMATSIGYLGILLGPALIGFAAKATSLSWALSMTALSLLVIIGTAPGLFGPRPACVR